MILLEASSQPEQVDNYALIFTVVGGIWALATFVIGYLQNRFKEKLESLNAIREYNKELRDWSNQVVDLMSQAGHLCDLDPQIDKEFFNKRHLLLIEVSAWIDKGRFFLPNEGIDEYGHHKPSAYRGFSSNAIDHMKKCYDLVHQINYENRSPNKEIRTQIMDAKRKFVSSIQDQLDPRKFEKEINKILKYRKKAANIEQAPRLVDE